MTFTVTGCAIDLGAGTELAPDCGGEVTTVSGALRVDAVRTVKGQLTGDPEAPIIPLSPDAVQIDVAATLSNFNVRTTGADTGLRIRAGDLGLSAQVYLAVSESLGACAVPTKNPTFHAVTLEDAQAEVDSGDSVFDVEVPALSVTAQVGRCGDDENTLSGEVTVWDTRVEVPIDGEFDGLDPDYDTDEYLESYACIEDLAQPISYDCPDLRPRLAQGVAQLTVSTYGNVAKIVDKNTNCGFKSPAVIAARQSTGPLGQDGGSIRYAVDNCRIDFDGPTLIATDCNGKETYAEGTVWVTGSKTVSGIITGDPDTPVIPTTRDPGIVSLSLVFENFAISTSTSDSKLLVRAGAMSGTNRTRTALDEASGACSIPTANTAFENLRWEGADVTLFSGPKQFNLPLQDSALQAQNGVKDDRENFLAGEVVIDGVTYGIPVEGEPVLDPAYDPEVFQDSIACLGPIVEAGACRRAFTTTLAAGAARLMIQTAGTIASQVNADDGCGFETLLVQVDPSLVVGEAGEMGSMTWEIEQCQLGDGSTFVYAENCAGGKTWVEGTATVDAKRTVFGERFDKFNVLDLIVVDAIAPKDRESVIIELVDVKLDEYAAYSIAAGASAPAGRLKIHTGTLSARVMPITGENTEDYGTFDIPTPVAILTDVVFENVSATLTSGARTFELSIDDVRLSAINGAYAGQANTVSGTLTVNGEAIALDPMPLDPAYDQADFDATYLPCTPNLVEAVPPD